MTSEHSALLAARREIDHGFLGLQLTAPGRASFELTRPLARHDGRLYGGTAVAAAITLAETVTGRPALWTTVQFVSGEASIGDRIDVEAEVLAEGRRTTQLQVTATTAGRPLFRALGATALGKDRALTGSFGAMPDVPDPESAEPFKFPLPEEMQRGSGGMERHMEIRVAGRDRDRGRLMFWCRVRGHRATPALVGYLADMIPMAVVSGFGHMGGGTSLDNTLRLGPPVDTDWILLQLDAHMAHGGYGTGTALVWSPDGALMAVASQTASLIYFD